MDIFENINKEYHSYYRSLAKKGSMPLRETEVGYWGISVADEVYELFKKINLSKYKNFLDLGSGDGRIVMIASLFTKSAGIEFDKELHNAAVRIAQKLNIKAELFNQDFFRLDLSKYDIIFFFPDKSLPYKLDKKFAKELKGKLIVYGPHFFKTHFLKKESVFDIDGTIISIFVNPQKPEPKTI